MFVKRFALSVLVVLASLYVVGCGGSAPAISITLTPSATSVDGVSSGTADTITVNAVVANDSGAKGVTWAVTGAGTLTTSTTTSATFKPSVSTNVVQTATITATSIADATKTQPVTITIAAIAAVTTPSAPPAIVVGGSGTLFTLTVSGGVGPYTWSVNSGTTAAGGFSPNAGTNALPPCMTLHTTTGAVTGTVNATCAGTYTPTFTVTDSGSPTPFTASEQVTLQINPAPAITIPTTLSPASATAGTAYSATITATGGSGALTYTKTAGTLPTGLTLSTAGVLSGTATVAGSYGFTVQAADSFGDLNTQTYTLTVNPGAATHFAVTTGSPATLTAGTVVTATVTALDANGNTATGYAGTVNITSTDSNAVFAPASSTLTNGVGSFNVRLLTVGSQTITAKDSVTATIAGSVGPFTVQAATASKLAITPATTTPIAGTPFNVTVAAQDQYGNAATSTDAISLSKASGPASFTALNQNLAAGTTTFSVTLTNAGSWTLTASDTTTNTVTSATTNTLTLGAAPAKTLVISPAINSPTAGVAFNVTVTAQDQYGNTATGTGSTDAISLSKGSGPGSFTTLSQNLASGTTTFSVTLTTAGSWTLTASDTGNGNVTAATTNTLTVSAAAASKLVINPSTTTPTAGTAFNVTVTEQDQFGNTISSSDAITLSKASGPASFTTLNQNLSGGATTFSVTLTAAGSWTFTATDTTNAGITAATTGTITLGAGAELKLTISPASTTPIAGTPFNVTVTVVDQYGNTVTGSTDGVTLSTPAASSNLPLQSPLSGGVHVFSVTLNTAGNTTITATNITSGSITAATTDPLTVSPATASRVIVTSTASSPVTAGTPFNVTVVALDPFNNTATSFTDKVHFTSTDTAAALPLDYTFVAGDHGQHTFVNGVTLVTAGSRSITATDASSGTVTAGYLGNIGVVAAAASTLSVTAPSAATSGVAFSATVTALDQYNNTATGYTGTIHFTFAPFPGGSFNFPANYTFGAGDAGVHTFTNGFNFTPTSGSGTFTVTATDTNTGTITGTSGNIAVSTALTITTANLTPLDIGQTPTQVMAASGGSGNPTQYSWSWTAQSGSSLPGGLNLSGAPAITGTPTVTGTFNVVLKVTDSGTSTSATANLSITIYPALSLPSTTLPNGYTNILYNGGTAATITGTGGSPTTSISVTTGLPAAGMSANANGEVLSISGTPTGSTAVPFTAKLTDSATGNSITLGYSIPVTSAPYPAIGSLSPSTASQGVAYTGSVSENGGIGPNYTWNINGTPLAAGASVGIGDSLYVSYTSGNSGTLNITGTPDSVNTNGVTFQAIVTDTISGHPSATGNYTIVVNSNGSSVSGHVSLNSACNNNPGAGFFTLTLTNTGTSTIFQTQPTDSNGNYTFTNVPDGTYSITPSVTAGAASTLFAPTSYTGLAVSASSNNNVTGKSFNGNVEYNVSGTVSYTGSQTGWTYIYLSGGCNGGDGGPGTAISETTLTQGGAYLIRGVPPGSYTINAWMDPATLGQGVTNANDPTGSTSVAVVSSNVGGKAITMADPTYATPASNPTIQGMIPNPQGALIEYQRSTNSNGVEDANQYLVQWSTSPTLGSGNNGGQFATITGSHIFTAGGDNGVWIITNQVFNAGLTNGTSTGTGFTGSGPYYFQARSFNTLDAANPHPSGWSNYGTTTNSVFSFTPVTIGTPACTSNCTTVSSSVTIPTSIAIKAGATLYLGLVELDSPGGNPQGIYVTETTSPVSGGSGNPFTVTVPNGSYYGVIGILDQNNVGSFGVGTITNVNDGLKANLTISSSTPTVAGISLPTANSAAYVGTQFTLSNCQGCSSTSTSYQLGFGVLSADKLPVIVTLNSGAHLPNNNGTVALDIANCSGCGSSKFRYYVSLPGGTPAVNNPYGFTVTYSDGTSDTSTSALVSGWDGGSTLVDLSDAVPIANMLPSGNTGPSAGTRTTPTFTWTDASNSLLTSDFYYKFYMSQQSGTCPTNGCTIWQVPGNNSNSNGFSSAITSLTWNSDPISGDNSSTNGSSLTTGDLYNWQVEVQDPYGNSAQTQIWYLP